MNKNLKNVFEGMMDAKGLKFAIICARFNSFFVSKLLEGAVDSLVRHGTRIDDINVAWVPGSNEIPLIASEFAKTGLYDAIIALGVVIQGATPHASLINNEVAKCLANISLQFSLPVINGVIAANDIEQAIERSGTKAGNKGAAAAETAIEMASLMKVIPKKSK
ncbi:MAG TPA: 6,7-dimethyl-8-ribityllumazine synthase [Victivallales bacterium]|nr:6,7-dimethyl-8-ribityllumazine synthase [Victivallales bacterium]HPO91144.1 6,7-dimethyl-8-ribityllumazine synthase [Victivallales bacterium]HRR29574.1 6,7-dimethyl-8-ribityllumazine synthase [Victivallales bacterium]HRU02373.1 6,7-dimethyl-8-ribityllumazine synthase [Victivallales bacterium]